MENFGKISKRIASMEQPQFIYETGVKHYPLITRCLRGNIQTEMAKSNENLA